MESIEFLENNIKVIQDDDLYHFTSDSILLSKFTQVKKNDIVADFCSGSGVVGFNLYALNNNIKSMTFFEMQESLFMLSKKSIDLNNLSNFEAVNCKVQEIDNKYNNFFSLIVCNPPYMDTKSGETSLDVCKKICKAEVNLKLEELIYAVSKCLRFGGRVNFVHRADRLVDIFMLMRKYKIEPKRVQFVCAKNKEPYLVLIEGVKGGKSGIKVLNSVNN